VPDHLAVLHRDEAQIGNARALLAQGIDQVRLDGRGEGTLVHAPNRRTIAGTLAAHADHRPIVGPTPAPGRRRARGAVRSGDGARAPERKELPARARNSVGWLAPA
jgi:hypothetical protein